MVPATASSDRTPRRRSHCTTGNVISARKAAVTSGINSVEVARMPARMTIALAKPTMTRSCDPGISSSSHYRAAARRAISSFETSSMCVVMNQIVPDKSFTWALRSP